MRTSLKNKGFIIPLIIAVVVVLAAGGAYLAYKKNTIRDYPVPADQGGLTATSTSRVSGSNSYKSEKFGFTLEFPMDWSAYSTQLDKSGKGIDFGLPGHTMLFSISQMTTVEWQSVEKGELNPYSKIDESDGIVYVLIKSQDPTPQFQDRFAEIPDIIKTFRVINY